jgi:clan AA aspartic protease
VIEGVVSEGYEAVVSLRLRGSAGQEQEVGAVIDTGFNRFLTLPPTLVTELDPPFLGVTRVVLANGSEETLDMYGVTVIWDGEPRDVDVLVADTAPLVGMALLESHSLYMEVSGGGRVVIDAIKALD